MSESELKEKVRPQVMEIMKSMKLTNGRRICRGDRIDAVRSLLIKWAQKNSGFGDSDEMVAVVENFNEIYCERPEAGEQGRTTLMKAFNASHGTLVTYRGGASSWGPDDWMEHNLENARCFSDGDTPGWWP